MAQISTSTWANELQRIYNRESLFEPMERHSTPCYDMFKEADDVEPLGAGLYFRLILNSANRVGTPSEGAATVTLIPGAHTTDALHLYDAWIEYTRKLDTV